MSDKTFFSVDIAGLAEALAERVRPTRELIAEAVRQIIESGQLAQKVWFTTEEASTHVGYLLIPLRGREDARLYSWLPEKA